MYIAVSVGTNSIRRSASQFFRRLSNPKIRYRTPHLYLPYPEPDGSVLILVTLFLSHATEPQK